MTKSTILPLTIAAVVLSGLWSSDLHAQAQSPTKRDLLENISDLQTLDPEIERYLPRWRVQEADLKIRLAQIFRLEGYEVDAADTFVVTASFPKEGQQDLLVIRANNLMMTNPAFSGKSEIVDKLGLKLYDALLARNYAFQVIPPATPITQATPVRTPSPLYPTNSRQFIALSASRQAVQIGTTGARVEHWIGNDEIGYHFWSSGQGRVFLNYPIIRLEDATLRANGVPDVLTFSLGAAYRLKFGDQGDDFLSGMITPRKLNGALGGKVLGRIEYRLPELDNFGFFVHAELPFSKVDTASVNPVGVTILRELKPRPSPIDSFNFNGYFLRNIAQGALFYEDWLNNYEHFFRISAGISYQDILRMSDRNKHKYANVLALEPSGLFHPTEVQDWIYAKVEYLNQAGFPFGASAQIANRNLLFHVFVPILPNWLFIEAKISTPVLRDDPQPWESKTFVMVSPILRFDLGNQ